VTDEETIEPPRPSVWRGAFAEPLSRLEAGRWLLLAFGGFLVGQVTSTVVVLVVAQVLGHASELSAIASSSSPPEWYVVASLLGLWVGFLGAPALAIRYAGPVRRRLGLRFEPIDLIGIGIGLLLQLAVGLLYRPFIQHLKHFNAPITKLAGASHGGGYALIVVLTVFGAPIAEEIFFRGMLLRSLTGFATSLSGASARKVAVGGAVLLDGLAFAASHGELAQLPGLVLVGVVLSLLFLRTGRLGMSILTHMSFNAVAIASYSASGGLILWLH
jgi:membrane protease YdiL (CAAX protease family)